MKEYTETKKRFVNKYGESVYGEIIYAIRNAKRKKSENEGKGRVYIDYDMEVQLSNGDIKGRAYCYIEEFTKELVIDYQEALNDLDTDGNPKIHLTHYNEYPVG